MTDFSQLSDEELMAQIHGTLTGGAAQPQSAPAPPASQPNLVLSSASKAGPTYDNVNIGAEKKMAEIPAAVQEDQQKKIADLNLKRDVYKKDLNAFLQIDEMIPRGEGIHRFIDGVDAIAQAHNLTPDSFGKTTPVGLATSVHDAAAKRLRVQLARAAGDTGNLNVVEQQAAEQLIPGLFDSDEVAKVKRAYLKQVGAGVDTNNPDLVVGAIQEFMKTKVFNKDKVKVPGKEVKLDEVFL